MSQRSLDDFGGYRKAMALFDHVIEDVKALRREPLCIKLVSQQVASAVSICANIEEGHGRVSTAEYVRFLDFARASARETRGRYLRMHHWLAQDVIEQRTSLLDEIIGILTSTMQRLRKDGGAHKSRQVRESPALYGDNPLSLAPRAGESDGLAMPGSGQS